jgi:hypothetical protein
MSTLTKEQIDRQELVDNSVQVILNVLSGKDLEKNPEHIEAVREAVKDIIVNKLNLMSSKEFYPQAITKITIERDPSPSNPREEFDNLGTMICFHGKYKLGDKHEMSREEAQTFQKRKDIIALPLYLYDHSGITIKTTSFNDHWDSGCVGFIYITKEKARKEYDWKVITKERRAKIEEYLRAEVKIYDQFLVGDVWGFETDDDSSWGFYGDYQDKSLEDLVLEHVGVKAEDAEIVWE